MPQSGSEFVVVENLKAHVVAMPDRTMGSHHGPLIMNGVLGSGGGDDGALLDGTNSARDDERYDE